MEENAGSEMGTRSRRVSSSDVSRGVVRVHQQGEDAFRQGCRTDFQHRYFQGRESNREAASSRLRTRGSERHAYRCPVLMRGTDPHTNN